MLCRLFFICIVLGTSQVTFTQSVYQQKADSLQLLLKQHNSDTTHINLLTNLGIVYARMSQTQPAYNYVYQGLDVASKQPDLYYEALARYSLGNVHLLSFYVDSAITQYNMAKLLLEHDARNTSQMLAARVAINLSQAYSEKGFFQRSAELLVEVLPELEKSKDTMAYATSLHNLAAAFITLGEYQKAYPYTLKDIALNAQTAAEPDKTVPSYLNAALLMYYTDSLVSMKFYLDEAEAQLRILGDNRLQTRCNSYKALYYTAKQQPALAVDALVQAADYLARYPDRETAYDLYDARRIVYEAQEKLKEARTAAFTLEKMAREDELPEYLLPALKNIAGYSRKLGDLSTAYQYLEKYTVAKDSVDKTQTVLQMNELELRYQSSQKERQIQFLQNQSKIQKIQLWVAIGFILLLALFFMYYFLQKKIQAAKQLQLLDHQRQIAITQALLSGEETERNRLARDLHDGLGSALAGIKLNLSRIADKEIIRADDLHYSVHQLNDTVAELRRIARNMMPESLSRSGLEMALKDLCEGSKTAQIKITFTAFHLQNNITPNVQVIIYRIVQEVLTNALKHSGADKIMVQCSQAENIFFITVEDNGRGFDVHTNNNKGMGLNNVGNRVNFLNGNMIIDSSAEGTIINIELNVNA